jgi:hypothetical protein
MSEQNCLRCKTVRLSKLPESNDESAFFECPNCGRRFSRIKDGNLVERWLSPISLLLYFIIFSRKPVQEVDRVVAHLLAVEQWPREKLDEIIKEVTLELEEPTQQVREILDLKASEEDVRAYLRVMVERLKSIDPDQYPGSQGTR